MRTRHCIHCAVMVISEPFLGLDGWLASKRTCLSVMSGTLKEGPEDRWLIYHVFNKDRMVLMARWIFFEGE